MKRADVWWNSVACLLCRLAGWGDTQGVPGPFQKAGSPTHGEWASTLQTPRNEGPEQSWGHSRERVPLRCRDRFGLGQLFTDRTEPRSTHFYLPAAKVKSREFSTRRGAPLFLHYRNQNTSHLVRPSAPKLAKRFHLSLRSDTVCIVLEQETFQEGLLGRRFSCQQTPGFLALGGAPVFPSRGHVFSSCCSV